ncbi:MAG TPA: hypothetical protein VMJ32_10220 [Pirellulales bacterium]|nr:hypothetical protein [Pirellulales bacterium]
MDQPLNHKLLIVGIETLAGSNLALQLADRCEVVGLTRHRGFALDGCRTLVERRFSVRMNSASGDEVCLAILDERPRWVVYCGPTSCSSWDGVYGYGANHNITEAGVSVPANAVANDAAANDAATFDANEEAKRLAAIGQAVKKCGAKLALVSTDAVCAGPQVFHREDMSVVHAAADVRNNPAPHAAWLIERQIDQREALVVRTHLYGWSAMGESYAERLWTALEDGVPFSVGHSAGTVGLRSAFYTPAISGRRYASPILATDFAELLWAALQRGLSGIFHAAGAERASQWQFVAALAAASGMWMNGSKSYSRDGIPHAAKTRAQRISEMSSSACGQETSLDSRKLQRAVGLPLPRLFDGLERFTQQAGNGYRDQLRAAFFAPLPEPVAA